MGAPRHRSFESENPAAPVVGVSGEAATGAEARIRATHSGLLAQVSDQESHHSVIDLV